MQQHGIRAAKFLNRGARGFSLIEIRRRATAHNDPPGQKANDNDRVYQNNRNQAGPKLGAGAFCACPGDRQGIWRRERADVAGRD